MTDPTILKAAARALYEQGGDAFEWHHAGKPERDQAREIALAVLAAVTPLIEAAALERAAKVADEQPYYPDTNIGMRQQWVRDQIAAKVRSLKEQP